MEKDKNSNRRIKIRKRKWGKKAYRKIGKEGIGREKTQLNLHYSRI